MNKSDQKAGISSYKTEQLSFIDRNYRSIIENNSFYIVKTDLYGRYTYLNPLCCSHFSLDKQNISGQSFTDLIMPEDYQIYTDTIKKCFHQAGQSNWVILRSLRDNTIVFTQWEFKVEKCQLDQPIEIIGIGHNITSIIRQQELQALHDITTEQNKKLINFTYVISHNIRSHIANIISIIELNDLCNEEEKVISWNIIKKSINGLDSTIHHLNDIITIQTNTNLPIESIQLRHELRQIINSINMIFDKAHTKIIYHFDESASIETNPAYLDSIVLNLLTNAVKYRSAERALQIDLSVLEEEEYKIMVFKDNGIGIDLEKNGDKIFGLYKTFHGNADAKGLGLYIIKTQIEAMGGKIEVDSIFGESTTFKVYFLKK
jgi:PAS domain S-box-containing protein